MKKIKKQRAGGMKCTPFDRQYDILKTSGVFCYAKGIPSKRYTAEFEKHVVETM